MANRRKIPKRLWVTLDANGVNVGNFYTAINAAMTRVTKTRAGHT